nr:hypothetical protein [Candidatus Sigynarchaeota archaeon]
MMPATTLQPSATSGSSHQHRPRPITMPSSAITNCPGYLAAADSMFRQSGTDGHAADATEKSSTQSRNAHAGSAPDACTVVMPAAMSSKNAMPQASGPTVMAMAGNALVAGSWPTSPPKPPNRLPTHSTRRNETEWILTRNSKQPKTWPSSCTAMPAMLAAAHALPNPQALNSSWAIVQPAMSHNSSMIMLHLLIGSIKAKKMTNQGSSVPQ